jgi:hypothetical protein
MDRSASLFKRIPREVLLTSSITPLRARACKVFLGRVGGLETEFRRDFGAGGRRASAGNGSLDQVQNLLLAGCELGRIEHVVGSTVLISSICIFKQF